MTLAVLKQKIDEIAADLALHLRPAIADCAGVALRHAVSAREGGRYVDIFLYWTEALDQDFVTAAEALEKEFTEASAERVVEISQWRGVKVLKRPSAYWLEGKRYRVKIALSWSIAENATIKWAAGMTDFGRLTIWGRRYDERSKTTVDVASEYLAEKAMREMFEKYFAGGAQ